MSTKSSTAAQHRSLPVLAGVVVLLLAAGTWVSWLGTRDQVSAGSQDGAESPPPATDSVVSIELLHQEPALPLGPHRERFQVASTVCHSPRLPLTQPRLPEKKWAEVVHKMVAVYGAPIDANEERDIIAYLTTVHGQ